jgi:tRNA (cmo5U34)-methyltransferase
VRAAFDATAHDYDASRRRLVPCFDAFYGAALSLLPFPREAAPTLLDLGAGTGLLAGLVAAAHPRATLVLVDVSAAMLERARERLRDLGGRARFVAGDLAELALPPCDAAVSALAIHHLDAAGKRDLFARVHAALAPGGVFVNADQVLGATPEAERRQWERWERDARALGADDAEIAMARERMREDRPSTLAEQLRWLREAGFRDVRCAFERAPFAVFAGTR